MYKIICYDEANYAFISFSAFSASTLLAVVEERIPKYKPKTKRYEIKTQDDILADISAENKKPKEVLQEIQTVLTEKEKVETEAEYQTAFEDYETVKINSIKELKEKLKQKYVRCPHCKTWIPKDKRADTYFYGECPACQQVLTSLDIGKKKEPVKPKEGICRREKPQLFKSQISSWYSDKMLQTSHYQGISKF